MNRGLTLILSLYLTLMALLPPAVLDECAKLPQLWEHYQFHRQDHPELSLMAFLDLHYGAGSTDHQRKHDHSKIPFKSPAHCIHAVWIGSLLPPLPVMWLRAVGLLVSTLLNPANFHYAARNGICPPSGCWHPPKQ
jgi:hypothetical protein